MPAEPPPPALVPRPALSLSLLLLTACSGSGADSPPPPPPSIQGAGPALSSCPPLDLVADEQLLHRAARLEGTSSVSKLGQEWRLRFELPAPDGWAVEYRLDLADPEVAGGVLRIYESESDAWPVYRCGPQFRRADGALLTATELSASATLISETTRADGVELVFEDLVDGETYRRLHTLQLVGGSLRIRVQSLETSHLPYFGNYAGLEVGPTEGTEGVEHLRFQGVLASPTFAYQTASGPWFLGVQLDLLQSRANDWRLPDADTLTGGGDAHAFAYTTGGIYKPNTAGELTAPLDETLSIAVAPRLEPVLVEPSRAASPYRQQLIRRTFVQLSQPKTWPFWNTRLSQFAALGMQELAWFTHAWWTGSPSEGVQNAGPDWFPAADGSGLSSTLSNTRQLGQLGGMYALFGLLPDSSSAYDPELAALDAMGAQKTWSGHAVTPENATRDLATAEATLFANSYAPSLIFADVQTYASPSRGAAGDSIDQRAGSGHTQTTRDSILERKRWLADLSSILEGPVLGEASQAHQDSSMEWLWLGACDGVTRTINTGSGTAVLQVPAGDPRAPTNWPIVPEYELRVLSELSVPHGNGPFLRFFSPSDAPLSTAPNNEVLPLSGAMLDRWRAYELSYGRAGHFQTSGASSAANDFLSLRQMMLETLLVGALQESYLSASIDTIRYRRGGLLQSFEEVWAAEQSLDAFRDAQLELRYDDGLVLWVNHAPGSWAVDVDGQPFLLPEDGFVGWRASDGLLAFSAMPPGATARVDYALSPGRYEFIDGRGTPSAFGGISTPSGRLVAHHFAEGLLIEELSEDQFERTELGAPALLSIRLDPPAAVLAPGERIGLTAWAEYAGGIRRDVTSRVDWSVSAADIARVDRGAVVTGCASGAVQIGGSALGIELAPTSVLVSEP